MRSDYWDFFRGLETFFSLFKLVNISLVYLSFDGFFSILFLIIFLNLWSPFLRWILFDRMRNGKKKWNFCDLRRKLVLKNFFSFLIEFISKILTVINLAIYQSNLIRVTLQTWFWIFWRIPCDWCGSLQSGIWWNILLICYNTCVLWPLRGLLKH